MYSTRNGFGNTLLSQANYDPLKGSASPLPQAAQQGSKEAMEFQLWVSQQAHQLAKLKIFHTMAKSVNDQQ